MATAALWLLVAACGSGTGDSGAAAGNVVEDTTSPAPLAAMPTAAEFLAEQAEQARRDSADYAARVAGMGTYAECIRQVSGLDSAAAAPIRRACGRLREAPR